VHISTSMLEGAPLEVADQVNVRRDRNMLPFKMRMVAVVLPVGRARGTGG